MKITIKSVEDRTKGDKTWKVVTDEKGKERHIFDTFKDKYPLLQVGHNIELNYETREGEKYPVLVSVKEDTIEEAVKTEEKSQYTLKYFEQIQMNRRTALMQACAGYPHMKDEGLLNIAVIFVNWLEHGDIPQKTLEPLPATPQEATSVPFSGTDDPKIGTPKYDLKDDTSYGKAVNNLCKQLNWKVSNLKAFMPTIASKLGGKVDYLQFELPERIIFVRELDKQLKEMK